MNKEFVTINDVPDDVKVTNCNDKKMIYEQDAIDIVVFECGKWTGLAKEISKQFKQLPPAQPEYRLDEWCHDCKEYDQDLHCCPRYNRVIRQALKDAQPDPCVDTIDALNESIKHFDDMAEECRRNANIERNDYMVVRDDAAEYKQLSIWLNELKWLRERFQSQPDLTTWEEKEVIHLDVDEPIIEAWQSMRCKKCERYYTAPYLYYLNEPNYCPYCGRKTERRTE